MSKRLIVAAIFAVVCWAAYWYWLDRVPAMFSIEPGGLDVVVNVDGRKVRPVIISKEGNLYSFALRHGTHYITVRKPHYRPQKQRVEVRWSDGDVYPVFPPLKPLLSDGRLETRRPLVGRDK